MESTLTKVHFSDLNFLCSLEKHTDHIQYNFEREKNVKATMHPDKATMQ